jgi:hypothetical protein
MTESSKVRKIGRTGHRLLRVIDDDDRQNRTDKPVHWLMYVRTTCAAQYIHTSSEADTVRHNKKLFLDIICWLCSYVYLLCHGWGGLFP